MLELNVELPQKLGLSFGQTDNLILDQLQFVIIDESLNFRLSQIVLRFILVNPPSEKLQDILAFPDFLLNLFQLSIDLDESFSILIDKLNDLFTSPLLDGLNFS